MEQYYAPQVPQVPQVTVKPDKEERREIRRRYNKIGIVLLINILIFNLLGNGGIMIIAKLFGNEIFQNEILKVALSFGVPIISEVTAIIVGVKMFGLKLRPMINTGGCGNGTVVKLIILSLGLQTAASFIASIITAILDMLGIHGKTADLSATTSLPANLMMYFYVCLLGPVLEELLYRGFLLQTLRKYNERFAIFISAAIFGLMHQNYQQFFLGFLVGIPLAVVTIKCGSLLPAIFTHIIMNTSASVFSCWIQYASPELYRSALNGTDMQMSDISGEAFAAVMCSGGFRIAVLIAGFIVGIVCLVKGGHMSRPTPAGKARTWGIFVTSAAWWVIFAAYMFLNLVYPFM